MGKSIEIGVADIPYPEGDGSTSDTANTLEKQYKIFSTYVEFCNKEITQFIENEIVDLINAKIENKIVDTKFLEPTAKNIEVHFKYQIASQAIEQMGLRNVPTQAALRGYSWRQKKFTGGRRASFVDTGLFLNSIRAWVT
jgi:hypothetical protein